MNVAVLVALCDRFSLWPFSFVTVLVVAVLDVHHSKYQAVLGLVLRYCEVGRARRHAFSSFKHLYSVSTDKINVDLPLQQQP